MQLQTHLVVREDALTLYGFATQRERWLFVALLGVSGLGPSKSLALLSGYPVDTLQRGIATGDTALLASISGIGKRTAERIVVELRDKLGAVALESVSAGSARRAGAPTTRTCRRATRSSRSASPCRRPRPRWPAREGTTEERLKEALAALRRGGPA